MVELENIEQIKQKGVVTIEGTGRFYRVDNIWVPSVTTIISQLNGNKFANIPHHIRMEGAQRGTVLHAFLEEYYNYLDIPDICDRMFKVIDVVKQREDVLSENMKPEVFERGRKLFMKFWEKNFLVKIEKIIASEQQISDVFVIDNLQVGYAGRFDLIAIVEGNLRLVDFKSSSVEKSKSDIENYYTQLPAYIIPYRKQTNTQLLGEIWMANDRNENVQRFVLEEQDIEHYYKKFQKLTVQYYKKHLNLINYINSQLC